MTDNSYKNWGSMSDKALSEYLGAFIKHHRIEQNRTQESLAKAAGISRSTLSLLEHGEAVSTSTFIQVLRVLDMLSVMDVFSVNQNISPLVLAKMEKKKRKRASGAKEGSKNESEW